MSVLEIIDLLEYVIGYYLCGIPSHGFFIIFVMFRFNKSVLVALVAAASLLPLAVDAGVTAIPGSGEFAPASMGTFAGDTADVKLKSAAFKFLASGKVILNGLAVIYLVYVGVMMIVAYGDDGELSKQKKQLMYAIVAFLFVNIPGQIYSIFADKPRNINVSSGGITPGSFSKGRDGNLFVNADVWDNTINGGVIGFIRIAVIGFALLYFIMAGFKLLVSGGDEDKRKSAKNQALYGFLALIFLGVIEAWTSVAYSGSIPSGQNLFAKLANLALFFAGPTAIFFLTL